MIIRLYATAVVLRFEPRWWQVLGSLPCHGKAPAPRAPARPRSLSLRLQAGGCGVAGFACVVLVFLCVYGGCPEGDLEPPLPAWPGRVISEAGVEIFSSPANSMLSHSLVLLHPKLFSAALGELTLLVNQGVTYFWLHLEIKCHLNYSVYIPKYLCNFRS